MKKNDIHQIVPWDIAVALVLLTRLPIPAVPDAAFARQAQAGWAFPLVGLVVAIPAAIVGLIALRLGLPAFAAAGLVLGTQIMLTGAMHEDGLADTADGLWGGATRDRRLEIMKDSAIGTYGVLALILSVGLRWVALAALLPTGTGALIAAAVISRAPLAALMTVLPAARENGLSRQVGKPGRAASLVALMLGLALAIWATGPAVIVPVGIALAAIFGLALLAQRKIGGQTGDILGAAQQMVEIVVLLGLVALGSG